MPLPKLNVPVYETILPSTDKVIKFRPFLVKEEKILLTASEDGSQKTMMNAVKDIIKNCVQEEIDVEKLPMFDIEYIFLKLRAKSVGEEIELTMNCMKEDCKGQSTLSLNVDEINVTKHENHNRKIMLTDDVGVMMSYPVMNTDGVTDEDGIKIVKSCIEMIFTNEETHERDSFSEKELDDFVDSMDSSQFNKIKQFFDTMPKLEHEVEYQCNVCGMENKINLQGLDSFFG
tara:strand:- start:31 stop:723 length:693 start_codon:yes stop_codon:yes gene_type:complete